MEFQSTSGTYAAVDPFKPSIAFSIKKILGSQKASRNDMDLDSPPPPPRVAASTQRYGAVRLPADTAPDWATWRPDPWIPQGSDSSIRRSTPILCGNVQGDLQNYGSNGAAATRIGATSTNSHQHNSPPYQNSEFRSRGRSRSPSVSDKNHNRGRSPSQRHRRSRTRSRSLVRSRSRRRSRSTRRSRSSSDARAPMVLIPQSPSESNSAAPRLVRTEHSNERPPPIITSPPSRVQELASLPPLLPSPIVIQSKPSSTSRRSSSESSKSGRSCSRTPLPIIPPHSPVLVPIESPRSPAFSPVVEGIEDMEALFTAQRSTAPEFDCSVPNGYLPPKEPDMTSSGLCRRGAVNLASEPLDEKQLVGLSDSSESVHLMTYVAAFTLDTLPRQLYLHFLLRLPYMYFSRVK